MVTADRWPSLEDQSSKFKQPFVGVEGLMQGA